MDMKLLRLWTAALGNGSHLKHIIAWLILNADLCS